jgi:nucleoid-associated protein YgaU
MVRLEQMYALTTPVRTSRRARRPRSPWPGRLRKSAVLAGAVLALSLGFAKVAEGGAQGPDATLTIQPGDTLWSIAASRYPGSDVRAKIWQIEQDNHLSGATLQPGQTIQVPSR